MIWGLLCAVLAAVCYGVGSVLQAVAARATARSETVDPRLLVRLVGQLPFAVGIGLDIAGFAAQFVALRILPIFVVQVALAAALAVTAVASIPILHARLHSREWLAVGAVTAGLALLGVSAGSEGSVHAGTRFQWALLGCGLALGVAGMLAGRIKGRAGSVLLGLIAGLGFGVVALSARALTDLSLPHLLTEPALYAMAVSGLIAFLFYATALQRGSVTTTTAALIVGETFAPAIVGLAVLGDHARPGFVPVAVAGFLIAVGGAIALARFGEAAAPTSTADQHCHGERPGAEDIGEPVVVQGDDRGADGGAGKGTGEKAPPAPKE